MADQTQAIRSFCELTETNEEIATSYLERVDYRIEAAIEHYFQESAVKGEETTNEKAMQKRKKEEEEERTKTVMCEWCCIDLDETASIYCTRDESEEERGRNRERHFYCLECGASAAERNGGRCGENGCTHRLIRAQFGLPIAHNDHMEVPQSEESRVEGIDRRKRQKRVNDDEEESSPDEVEEEEEKEGEEEEKEEEEESEEEDEELEEFFVYYRRPSPDVTEEGEEEEGEEEEEREDMIKKQKELLLKWIETQRTIAQLKEEDKREEKEKKKEMQDQVTRELSIAFARPNDSLPPPVWADLPERARPAFDLICSHLRTNEDCIDLANLSMVCSPFRPLVMEFMRREANRPGLKAVHLNNHRQGLWVDIHLFPSNRPFYGLEKCPVDSDGGSFKCCTYSTPDGEIHTLNVALTGPEDPFIKQVADFLSVPIELVSVYGMEMADLSLADQLLGNSPIAKFDFPSQILDDTTASLILSMAARTTEAFNLCRYTDTDTQLSDPTAFVNKLGSMTINHVKLEDAFSSSCFGFPNSFWENFLNEKLSSGSAEWVQVGDLKFVDDNLWLTEDFEEAPIDLSSLKDLNSVEWKKADTM